MFERVPLGAVVAGGMGGGVATREAWIRPELVGLGLDIEIRATLRASLTGYRPTAELSGILTGLCSVWQALRGRRAHSLSALAVHKSACRINGVSSTG